MHWKSASTPAALVAALGGLLMGLLMFLFVQTSVGVVGAVRESNFPTKKENEVKINYVLNDGVPFPQEGEVVYVDPNSFSGWPFDFQNLAQNLATLEGLEQDIKEKGILNAVTAWANSGKAKPPIVAGCTRLAIALKLGIPLPVIFKNFPTPESAKIYAICDNSIRRDSTPSGRARMGDELWRLYDAAPDKKEWAAKGLSPRARAAKASLTSEGGLAKYKFIQQNGSDKVKADLDADKITINAAYTTTMASLNEKTDSGPPPPRIEKILQDLDTLLPELKGLPDLTKRIRAAERAITSTKAAYRASIKNKFKKAAKIIEAAENSQALFALYMALVDDAESTPPVEGEDPEPKAEA